MSDTDDTDDLLLIPPDFFVIDSDVEDAGPYYGVVSSLITVVNDLETRLNSIENSSDNLSNICDYKFMSGARRSLSSEELPKYGAEGLESAQSTPQKPRTTLHLNSLPNTPNVGRYSLRKTQKNFSPSKRSDLIENVEKDEANRARLQKSRMFSDINTFISNVNSLKQLSAARNLENDFFKTTQHNTQQHKDNPILVRMDNELQSEFLRRGFEVKNANISKISSSKGDSTSTYLNKLSVTSCDEPLPSTMNDESLNSDFTDNSQATAYQISQNATNNLRKEVYDVFSTQGTGRSLKESNAKLMSLQDLWSDGRSIKNVNSSFQQKLEEEKIKRQHCELTIQSLQCKLLEMQEKVAVAVEVDKSKDEAILKFHDAWEQISLRMQSLTAERNSLEDDLRDMQAKCINDLSETAKKVAHYEQEASKALNIAHMTQDKMASLEISNKDLAEKLDETQRKLVEVTTALKKEIEKCKRMNDLLLEKDAEHNKTKLCLENARSEIAESKKAVDLCQAEFIKMKTQYNQLELQMNNDRDFVKGVEASKKKMQEEMEVMKKTEKVLREECRKLKENSDQNKAELRNFYQDQVEIVVKDKLKEFQTQLDHAEISLQEELKKKEATIIKSAALHIQQLSEKHHLEVQLLEEKHKEEMRLFQIKLSQTQRHMEDLQLKFNHQKEYKANIAEQLQRVMEAQWQEAIRILNTTRSPGVPQDQNYAYEQLNSLKSRSYSNLEELITLTDKKFEQKYTDNKFGAESISSGGDYEVKFKDNIEETPVSSRQVRSREQIEHDLQRLVAMLSAKSKITPEIAPDKDIEARQQEERASRNSGGHKKHKPPWK